MAGGQSLYQQLQQPDWDILYLDYGDWAPPPPPPPPPPPSSGEGGGQQRDERGVGNDANDHDDDEDGGGDGDAGTDDAADSTHWWPDEMRVRGVPKACARRLNEARRQGAAALRLSGACISGSARAYVVSARGARRLSRGAVPLEVPIDVYLRDRAADGAQGGDGSGFVALAAPYPLAREHPALQGAGSTMEHRYVSRYAVARESGRGGRGGHGSSGEGTTAGAGSVNGEREHGSAGASDPGDSGSSSTGRGPGSNETEMLAYMTEEQADERRRFSDRMMFFSGGTGL